jgi:hypothetical protein
LSPYAEAVDAADPAAVLAASDVPSARALLDRFWDIAEDLPAAGADPATLGDAMDMAGAEAEVVAAAQAAAMAGAALAEAEAELAAAQAAAGAAETDQECARAEADVTDAQAAVAAAAAALAAARARLEHALHDAARTAATMRSNLQARHGGISEAVGDARARVAERDFYTNGAG